MLEHIQGFLTSTFFTGKNNPQFVFDNTIFFGILGAASRTRGDDQPQLGGNSNAKAWNIAELTLLNAGATPATNNFLGSLRWPTPTWRRTA